MGGWVGGWTVSIRFYSYLSQAKLRLRLSLAKKDGIWTRVLLCQNADSRVSECDSRLNKVEIAKFIHEVAKLPVLHTQFL